MRFNLSSDVEILSTIGNRLREQRIARSLRQAEVAAMAGISRGALRSLESTGRSSTNTLVRVVQALGLVADLDPLFVMRKRTIADMARTAEVSGRRRVRRQVGQP